MTVFDQIMQRFALAFQTGGFEPLNRRSVDALAVPAATGLPGGARVRDLEKYQVSLGASRFGDMRGGYTYSPGGQAPLSEPVFMDITKGENFSRSPGFRDGPIEAQKGGSISGTPGFRVGPYEAAPQNPQPRSSRGASELTDYHREHMEQV